MLVALKPKPMLAGAADAGAASTSTAAASTAGTSAMTLIFIFIFQALPSVIGNRWLTMTTSSHGPPLVGGELVAAGGQDVPPGTELVQPLPRGVPRPVVAGVVVERVTVVGRLSTAVAADARAEQDTGHAGPGSRGPVAEVRRPGAGARAVAVGLARRVRLEQVERASLTVDQGLPQRGAAQGDDRSRR